MRYWCKSKDILPQNYLMVVGVSLIECTARVVWRAKGSFGENVWFENIDRVSEFTFEYWIPLPPPLNSEEGYKRLLELTSQNPTLK